MPSLEVTLYSDGLLLDDISKKFVSPTGARLGEAIEIFMDNIARQSTGISRGMLGIRTEETIQQLIILLTSMTCIHEICHAYGCNEDEARKAQWIIP